MVRMSRVNRMHRVFGAIAGLVVVVGAILGAHTSDAQATDGDRRSVESSECHDGHGGEEHHSEDHDGHDHGDNSSHDKDEHRNNGHDNSGHDKSGHRNEGKNRGRDDRGRGAPGPAVSGQGLQQIAKVAIPATTFLRVDRNGRVTEAATNTGCQPGKRDDMFLLKPDGKIVSVSAAQVERCDWTGDFRVSGRFQRQSCRAEVHG
jgi:hypothetical protein